MKEKNLIVFFVPQKKVVNGGVLSIFSQCKEARRFSNLHHSEVILCTYPGYDTYVKNDLFDNDEIVYSFDQVIDKWKKPDSILLHIPECAVVVSSKNLLEKYDDYLKSIDTVRINVMTQNIELLPSIDEFAKLFVITPDVTQTTAHQRYATQALSNGYRTPVHHMSVFCDKSQYDHLPYSKKKNLIIYSPDKHPDKQKVLEAISSIKGFDTQEVKDLSYDEYKKLTASAKFCVTFGEGFDGYFIESFFSGSIGFAVYNENFFPDKSFLDLPSVFDSYDSMLTNLPETIERLDNERQFNEVAKAGLTKVEEIHSFDGYIRKMEAFYRGDYDFLPESGQSPDIIGHVHEALRSHSKRQHESIKQLEQSLTDEQAKNHQLQSDINRLLSSSSWKITKPLRQLKNLTNNLLGL